MTPLVISGATRPAPPEEQAVYRWADTVARAMIQGSDFTFDPKRQKIELATEGRRKIRWSSPPCGPKAPAMDKLQQHVERALQANVRFRCDQHYLVDNDKVEIIDEGTGRRMPDRHWSEGLHQAVEAKENVTITMPADHSAQITFVTSLYKKLAGMTGTLPRISASCLASTASRRLFPPTEGPPRTSAQTGSATEEPSSPASSRRSAAFAQDGRCSSARARWKKSERLSRRLTGCASNMRC